MSDSSEFHRAVRGISQVCCSQRLTSRVGSGQSLALTKAGRSRCAQQHTLRIPRNNTPHMVNNS